MIVGCAAPADSNVEARGLGLADGVVGSCVDACGDAAPEGNCWCDEACIEHGDCCGDKVDSCGGEAPDPALPVLCREVQDCSAGLTCDQNACYSGCVEGDDCEDACLGMCVEPQQQSLPSPSGSNPAEPDDDDDDGKEDDGDDDGESDASTCSCPAGDLCVPLCPVCPPEVPDEDCQCTVVCVSL